MLPQLFLLLRVYCGEPSRVHSSVCNHDRPSVSGVLGIFSFILGSANTPTSSPQTCQVKCSRTLIFFALRRETGPGQNNKNATLLKEKRHVGTQFWMSDWRQSFRSFPSESEIIEELSKPCMRKSQKESVYEVLSGAARQHERKIYI